MKTFKHYLIELIIIISFGLALTWLASCDTKTSIQREIYKYRDSIGMCKARIILLDLSADSMRNEYSEIWPAKTFPLTRAGDQARAAYAAQEHLAYMDLLKRLHANDVRCDSLKQLYLYKIDGYNRKIEQLKIEIE
jgi:hypothetical protein